MFGFFLSSVIFILAQQMPAHLQICTESVFPATNLRSCSSEIADKHTQRLSPSAARSHYIFNNSELYVFLENDRFLLEK